MVSVKLSCLLYTIVSVFSVVKALVDPTETYDGGFGKSDVLLRIATGGAGQSGLVRVLSDAFIKERVSKGRKPFSIGWVLSDTTFTIKNLATGEADLGISYVPAAEQAAADQGIIFPKNGSFYLFRDHFIIAGPPENPAGISGGMNVSTIFAKIYQAAELNNATTEIPTRFLSRFDKSATNIKESSLWLGIGQAPWSLPYSTWYHQYPAFPIQALTAASLLKEYTLTDKGTYLSLAQQDKEIANATTVYKTGTDNKNDPLLLPGHLLVGRKASNLTLAYEFVRWATGPKGQKVVTGLIKNGTQLYSGAPKEKAVQLASSKMHTTISHRAEEANSARPLAWTA